MKELKLLYSYEEWKNRKGLFDFISDESTKFIALSFNYNRTESEEKEYQELKEILDYRRKLSNYTDLVHIITDMYNELKYTHDDDKRKELYESIGRKQCEIEIIKENF